MSLYALSEMNGQRSQTDVNVYVHEPRVVTVKTTRGDREVVKVIEHADGSLSVLVLADGVVISTASPDDRPDEAVATIPGQITIDGEVTP